MHIGSNLKTWLRRLGYLVGGFVLLLAGLAIPDCEPPAASGAGSELFTWSQDSLWQSLQRNYEEARAADCSTLAVSDRIQEVQASLDALAAAPGPPSDPRYRTLEARFFAAAPYVAACPDEAPALLTQLRELRRIVKRHSRDWDMESRESRETLYRLLYGARATTEEILLQQPEGSVPTVIQDAEVPSAAPSAMIQGVRIHSGDILVSRGGAPTSSLIARGNDFPGNFSHIALVHIDEETQEVSVIEAHIETGVVIADVERYLQDTKLRIMVLRARPDLPELQADPSLAHRAATHSLEDAQSRHIPYDFAMDYEDPTLQFCSEVASAAYASQGISLWTGLTSMSGSGLTRWLSLLGVEHFRTHGPSDLEYDPQLLVVAEWRDPELLFSDHVDNAVTDTLIEYADRGLELSYDPGFLPFARLMKGWSVLQNLFGRLGPVPEGMSATVGLRVQTLRELHGQLREVVIRESEAFREEHGYRPPYWELMAIAQQAAQALGFGDNEE